MSALLNESIISMGQAARRFPGIRGAKTIAPSTVWRWCLQGTKTPDGRTVHLEFVRVGSRVLTSTEALDRYIAALNSAAPSSTTTTRTPAERQRAAAQADAALAAAGA